MLPLNKEDYNWIPYRTVKTTQLPVDIPHYISNMYSGSHKLQMLKYYFGLSDDIESPPYPTHTVDFTYFELLAGCLLERNAAYYEAAGISLSKEHIYFLDIATSHMTSYDITRRINNMASIRSIMNVQYYMDAYIENATLNKCVRRVPILNSMRQKPVLLPGGYVDGLIDSAIEWTLERIIQYAQNRAKDTSKYAPSNVLGCHVKLNSRYLLKQKNNPYVDMHLKLREVYDKLCLHHTRFKLTASPLSHVQLTTLTGKTLTTHTDIEKYLFDTQLNLVLKDILFPSDSVED